MLHRFIVVYYLAVMAFSLWQIYFINPCSVKFILWRHFHWNSLTLLVTLIFFNFVQMCVQSIFTPYCSSHLIWHFGFIFCLKIPWITFIFNLAGDLVVFDSYKNCSLSLILKVTLRSGTISVSPFNTLLHNWISSCNVDHSILGDRFVE